MGSKEAFKYLERKLDEKNIEVKEKAKAKEKEKEEGIKKGARLAK